MQFRSLVSLSLCLLVLSSCGRESASSPVRNGSRSPGDIFLAPDTATIKDRVPQRVTLASLLRDLDVRGDIIPLLIQKTNEVFDPRRLHAGHAYEMVRTTEGLVRSFEYEIDLDKFLRISATPGSETSHFRAELVPYKKDVVPLAVQGQISRETPSLFASMEDAGETPDLTLALADVFSGEIDFHTDLQPGDSYRVAVDRVLRSGEPVAYGPIAAAEFTNAGRVHKAILFTPPGGKPGYYDEQGRSLRRFFLASPLKFTLHVTSRFSRARFHPILKIFRPHLGVDYAAPTGTPVNAVADGVVLSAGWSGEGGRMVHLRHQSGYETYYMHLSAISVRAGQHVSQGQLIGRVGMTGMATGPHLDYRIKKTGNFVNPQTVAKSLPPGDPIPAGAMEQFRTVRDTAFARLTAPAPTATAAPSPASAARH